MMNRRVGDRKFLILKVIGTGTFGDVYRGVNVHNGEDVAIKIEDSDAHEHLHSEYMIYKTLGNGVGIPTIHHFCKEEKFNVLVMDLLGPSLQTLFEFCFKHFTMKTVLMLADQMLEVLAYMHSKGYIHRDIKPENFLMGYRYRSKRVYLIDYGLACKYLEANKQRHVQYRENMKFVGTARFASLRTHVGFMQSRRDDLESLGYCFMYFLLGRLPWQGAKSQTKPQKCEIIHELKLSCQADQLCKGFPAQFAIYLDYCRNIAFEETPDYDFLRNLFKSLLKTLNHQCDFVYDWKILIDKMYQKQKNRAILSKTPEGECDPLRRRGKYNWFEVMDMKECRNPNLILVRAQEPNKKCKNAIADDVQSGDPILKDDEWEFVNYSKHFC